jgi:tetratricopeptide (TPR) repeat protein
LASIYRAEGRPQDAKRVLTQAREIFSDDPDILWELEESILALSLQRYREVTELAGRLNTSEAYRELRRSASDWALRRIEVCQARLARDPSLVHLRIASADAMLDAECYEEAITEVEPLLDHDELSPQANLIRGRALLALGRDVDAMVALRAAALRRSVTAPVRVRVAALRLLCESAERLEFDVTLTRYRDQLRAAEDELAKQSTLVSDTTASSS